MFELLRFDALFMAIACVVSLQYQYNADTHIDLPIFIAVYICQMHCLLIVLFVGSDYGVLFHIV